MIRALALFALLFAAGNAEAKPLRFAFWNTELGRKGPGELLRDLSVGKASDITAAIALLDALDADTLVLGGFDYDAEGLALSALNQALKRPYSTLLPLRPNSGISTGFDLDGNGKLAEARDAQGFGWFPGQGGMAILSRMPIDLVGQRDFSGLLWRDLPSAHLPPLPEGAADVLRLSSVSHVETSVVLPDGRKVGLLTWHATTPAFDGPEDRNGLRNFDENHFWLMLLNGELEFAPPAAPFLMMGQANLDPDKGDGRKEAIRALLDDAHLQSPLNGDTVDYGDGIGPLRVDYILPSSELHVTDSGVFAMGSESRHWPIWVEIEF